MNRFLHGTLFLVSLIFWVSCDYANLIYLYAQNGSSQTLMVEYQKNDAYGHTYEKELVVLNAKEQKLISQISVLGGQHIIISECKMLFNLEYLLVKSVQEENLYSQNPVDSTLWECTKRETNICDCTFTITEEMLTSPDDLPDSGSIDSTDTLEIPDNI